MNERDKLARMIRLGIKWYVFALLALGVLFALTGPHGP